MSLLCGAFFVIHEQSLFTLFFPHQDGKTALYWAVEKGNATMVRDILQCNPDTESCTKVQYGQQNKLNLYIFKSRITCAVCLLKLIVWTHFVMHIYIFLIFSASYFCK